MKESKNALNLGNIPHSSFPIPHSFLQRLDVFSGAANPAEARIYARLELSDDELNQNLQLNGRIVGPECAFSHTLPARMTMMDRSLGNTLLLEAVVPDPCFWTTELTFLYRAQLELRSSKETIAKYERTVGIRRLGVRDGGLHFDGKRFVLRAINRKQAAGSERDEDGFCRETWTAILVSDPDERLCEFASRNGMLLIANVTKDFTVELRRLSQWPAVAMAILNGEVSLPANVQEIARNLLLAQQFEVNQPLRLAEWAQIAVIEVAEAQAFAGKIKKCDLPIIAYRPQFELATVELSRAECDKLQRDLASWGDFAGYLV